MMARTVMIANPSGLHARPAGEFCEAAAKFSSDVSIRRLDNGMAVNGKSILHVLMGKLACGTAVAIHCDGEDEEEALNTLVDLVEHFTE